MIISKIKIDSKGRINLPMTLLKANKLKRNAYVTLRPIAGRNDAIKLEFELEGETNGNT